MSTIECSVSQQYEVIGGDVTWTELVQTCAVLLCPEEGGGFSAHALNLPGVVSQGETMDEALANIKEAVEGAIAAYRELGDEIPWGQVTVDSIPAGSQTRQFFVNA